MYTTPFRNHNTEGHGRVRCNTWPGIKEEASPSPEAKPSSRVNVWGNQSYADLITRAITSSPQQKLTLTQIYDWLIENVPHFREKSDKASSAGWKNSIRHNLSLHSKFVKVQNEVAGKSSWWMINHQVKEKPGRRRCSTMDSKKMERKRQNVRQKVETLRKIKEENFANCPWFQRNETPQTTPVQTFVQPGPSTSHFGGNRHSGPNGLADQNYNHMVATFQYGMTLYYPSTSISHTNNSTTSLLTNNVAIPASSAGSVQSQNLDDLDLDPIRLPVEIDVEGIIRTELEIDGRLDFI